jgi:hypothetical protein
MNLLLYKGIKEDPLSHEHHGSHFFSSVSQISAVGKILANAPLTLTEHISFAQPLGHVNGEKNEKNKCRFLRTWTA